MDLGEMMNNMKGMASRLQETQESLKNKVIEGEAGAGMIKVRMNGLGEVVGLDIEKEAIDPDDPEMLADLIVAAINTARKKVEASKAENIQSLAGGLDLSKFGIDLSGLT